MKWLTLPCRIKIVLYMTAPPLLLVCLSFFVVFQNLESDRKNQNEKHSRLFVDQFKNSLQDLSKENMILAESLMLSYEFTKGNLNASGLSLFKNNQHLLKFEIYDPKNENIVFRIQKKDFEQVLNSSVNSNLNSNPSNRFTHLDGFILLIQGDVDNDKDHLKWKVYVDSTKYFLPFLSMGHLSIWNKNKIVLNNGSNGKKNSNIGNETSMAKVKLPHSDLSFQFSLAESEAKGFPSKELVKTLILLFIGFLSLILCLLPFIGNISFRMRKLKKRVAKRMELITQKRTLNEIDHLIFNKMQLNHSPVDWELKTKNWEISYKAQTRAFDRGQFVVSFQCKSSIIIGCFSGKLDAIETSRLQSASMVLFEQFKNDELSLHEVFLNWENGISMIQNDLSEITYAVFEFDTETYKAKFFTKRNFFGLQINEQNPDLGDGYKAQILNISPQGDFELAPGSAWLGYFGKNGPHSNWENQTQVAFADSMSVRAEFCKSTSDLISKSKEELEKIYPCLSTSALGCLVFRVPGPERTATLDNECYEIKYVYEKNKTSLDMNEGNKIPPKDSGLISEIGC